MGKIKTKTYWECDVCRKQVMVEKEFQPNGWKSIKIEWPQKYSVELLSCDDCGPEEFGYTPAVNFIQRFHRFCKGVRNE